MNSQKRGQWRQKPTTEAYEQRYAENWPELSRAARASTGGRCCFPKCRRKATAAHHCCYSDRNGPIAGREIVGIHIFGLCDKHHSKSDIQGAHHPNNWHPGTRPDRLDAWNTKDFWQLLRSGWLEKNSQKPIRTRSA